MDWQPIETAPRTGEWVLVGRWERNGPHSKWFSYIGRTRGELWDTYPGTDRVYPTHWMPLPPPPQPAPEGE